MCIFFISDVFIFVMLVQLLIYTVNHLFSRAIYFLDIREEDKIAKTKSPSYFKLFLHSTVLLSSKIYPCENVNEDKQANMKSRENKAGFT